MVLAFELIQVALGKREQLDKVPSAGEWEKLQAFAYRQTLVGVMFSGVEKLPKAQRPPIEILLDWYGTTEEIKSLNLLMDKQVGKVAGRLEKAGFPGVVLKGQGLARLYPEPLLRMSGDIDIWLKGRRRDIVAYLRGKGVDGRVVYHNMPFELDGYEVEAHFTPSWMNCYLTNRRLQRFFASQQAGQLEHIVKIGESGTEIPVPTQAFNRVFVLQHIYRHLFGSGIGLRQLMDYYYVLEQGFTDSERMETLLVLRQLHMLKFARAVMYVLQTVFGMEERNMLLAPDEKEGRFLLAEIMRAGNFGCYDDRIVIPEDEGKLHSFFRITRQNMRLLKHYPKETLWNPVYRAWHYVWRKVNGYPI